MTEFVAGALAGAVALFAVLAWAGSRAHRRRRGILRAYRIVVDMIPPENMSDEKARKIAQEFANCVAEVWGFHSPISVARVRISRREVAKAAEAARAKGGA